ncbi:MAG: WhiB family transcriptional regulator [Mycobacteriales bacterium]
MDRWQEQAACNGMDVELFYPVTSDLTPSTRQALRICAGCPVREICLAEARSRGERYGIWGGMLPEQRGVSLARRAS